MPAVLKMANNAADAKSKAIKARKFVLENTCQNNESSGEGKQTGKK